MRKAVNGKTVYVEMSVWWNEEQGHIHLAAPEVEGFHSPVNNVPGSKRCHPNLFRKLAKCLKQAGAPHPETVEDADN